jgi:hypothetical protein
VHRRQSLIENATMLLRAQQLINEQHSKRVCEDASASALPVLSPAKSASSTKGKKLL